MIHCECGRPRACRATNGLSRQPAAVSPPVWPYLRPYRCPECGVRTAAAALPSQPGAFLSFCFAEPDHELRRLRPLLSGRDPAPGLLSAHLLAPQQYSRYHPSQLPTEALPLDQGTADVLMPTEARPRMREGRSVVRLDPASPQAHKLLCRVPEQKARPTSHTLPRTWAELDLAAPFILLRLKHAKVEVGVEEEVRGPPWRREPCAFFAGGCLTQDGAVCVRVPSRATTPRTCSAPSRRPSTPSAGRGMGPSIPPVPSG